MAIPTNWKVPAITAGTPQARVFRKVFPNAQFQWRKEIEIYNHSSGTLLTILINGSEEVKLAAGDSRLVDWVERIYSYTIDAAANTNLGDIEVDERGGLDAP